MWLLGQCVCPSHLVSGIFNSDLSATSEIVLCATGKDRVANYLSNVQTAR